MTEETTVEDKADLYFNYLNKERFVEAFERVVLKMFAMDPELPTDPLKYIKENIDYSMKEARETLKELEKTTLTCQALEKENSLLRKYMEKFEASEQSFDWSSESDKPAQQQETKQ